MRNAIVIATLGLLCLPAAAPAADESHRDAQLLSGAQALAARDAYLAHCAGCHGETGGGSAGTDFGSPEAVARLTRAAMIEAAGNGHADASGAHRTPDLETRLVAGIVDYVRDALMLPAPLADASVGRRIYARSCSVCHGERGDAASWAKNSLNPPPFDFTADRARRELDRQRMVRSVTYGVRDTAMMPFATQLSREEIGAVVDYVRANFVGADDAAATTEHMAAAPAAHGDHGHAAAGAAFDPEAAFPAALIGDYAGGKTLFENNCVECHGRTGDGKGRRAYFMRQKPEDFTSPEARAEFNRPHLFEAVSKGVLRTEMSAWSKVLGEQQIADVAEYVFRTFIRPTAAESSGVTQAPTWQAPADARDAKKKP